MLLQLSSFSPFATTAPPLPIVNPCTIVHAYFVEEDTETQKCTPGTRSISLAQELVRSAESQTPPQITESKSAFLKLNALG